MSKFQKSNTLSQSKGFAPIIIILGIVLLLSVAGGAYYFGQSSVKAPTSVSQVPVTTTQTSVSPTQPLVRTTISPTSAVDETVNPDSIGATWKTYTNTKYNFSIKYPLKTIESLENWQYEESGDNVNFNIGFGTPSSKSGGYIWGIWVTENGNIENLIKQMGSQFTDRKEKRENIKINGISALLVTVTTEQIKEFKWIFKNVYIQKGNKIYSIGNGANDSSEFELFYNSFKFLN